MLTENKKTGFESADIVFDLEETFGLKFSDQELQNTHTVGEIYDLIVGKLPYKAVLRSTKIQIFYELKKELNIETLRPSSRLLSFVPREWRKSEISNAFSRMPELKYFRKHPRWLQWLILLSLLLGIPFAWRYHWLLSLSGVAFAFFLNWSLRRFDIIESTARIRDIVNIRSELEFLKRAQLTGTYNPKEVWEMLKAIIGRYLDTRNKSIGHDTRFVEDLGLSE